MIVDFAFLWKQLNGPQITGIAKAVREFVKTSFDSILDYFNKLSITTATSEHLTLIGILQGIARPIVPLVSDSAFQFSGEYEYITDETTGKRIPSKYYPASQGFTDTGDAQGKKGGRFTEEGESTAIAEGTAEGYIDKSLFRIILNTVATSKGKIGSLVLLNDIVYKLWSSDSAIANPAYDVHFITKASSSRCIGDLEVELGNKSDWNTPAQIYAILNTLGKTRYYNGSRLFGSMGG
jgi:hypothetical protein